MLFTLLTLLKKYENTIHLIKKLFVLAMQNNCMPSFN